MRFLILTIFTLSSCAFKIPPEQPLAPLEISWGGNQAAIRQISKTGSDFTAVAPLTLPTPVPDDILLRSPFLPPSPNASTSAFFDINGRKYQLQAKSTADGLNVKGFAAILPADHFQAGTLSVFITDSSGAPSQLIVNLRTQPSGLQVTPQTIAALNSEKVLSFSGRTLDLIRGIALTNSDSVPVQISLKNRWLLGDLRRSTKLYPTEWSCDGVSPVQDGSLAYETNFVVLSLSEPSETLSDQLSRPANFVVPAKSSITLLLYAEGKWLKDAYDKSDFSLNASTVPMDADCGSTHYHGFRKVGLEGGAVLLHFSDDSEVASASLLDDQAESWTQRTFGLLANDTTLF